jgi:predicted GNAT superfamily acetyltransferase
MLIRPLKTLEDCRTVVELERSVWEYADSEDVVPVPILVVSVKRGGILLGAFDDAGEMKGFVYSLAALKDGRPTQWSHMLGVAEDARGSGLGARLKLAQRDHARGIGVDLIEWTYDPLQSLNAHLNFAKLGVVVREYAENIYGDSSSPLHQGTPTDRFIAEWHLSTPHVERRIAALGRGILRDAAIGSIPVVNPSKTTVQGLVPGPAALDLDARRLLVEIPTGFGIIQARHPSLALEWRLATRQIFQTYFSRGYNAVDFYLARETSRGQYLLSLIPDR